MLRRKAKVMLTCIVVSAATASSTLGQSHTPDPADVGTIDGIIAAFYDVITVEPGEKPDWARDSTLYLPDVRFLPLRRLPSGGVGAERLTHAQFAAEADWRPGSAESVSSASDR